MCFETSWIQCNLSITLLVKYVVFQHPDVFSTEKRYGVTFPWGLVNSLEGRTVHLCFVQKGFASAIVNDS